MFEKFLSRHSRIVLRRLRNVRTFLGAGFVLTFIFMAIFAPFISPYDPLEVNLPERLQPPSLKHLFGTDALGRDILSRVIFGARITLMVTFTIVVIGLLVGTFIGTIAAFVGGIIDSVLMRVVDVMMALPGLLICLLIVSIIGPGITGVIVAVGISSIPLFARVSRATVLSVKENDYVQAARAIGESRMAVVLRYVLPNCTSPIIVLATLRMATGLLFASSLSFLGLGVQPPLPEWGTMLSDARNYLRIAIFAPVFPGLAITLTALGFNMLGDSLRDALHTQLK